MFDEVSHGLVTMGVLDVLLEHGLGPALLLAVLAGGRVPARAKRLGPAEPEAEDTRSDAVDLVASLAQLYARAITRGEARLYGDADTEAVHSATGLSGRPLQERVRAVLFGVFPSCSASVEPSAGQFVAGLRAL